MERRKKKNKKAEGRSRLNKSRICERKSNRSKREEKSRTKMLKREKGKRTRGKYVHEEKFVGEQNEWWIRERGRNSKDEKERREGSQMRRKIKARKPGSNRLISRRGTR